MTLTYDIQYHFFKWKEVVFGGDNIYHGRTLVKTQRVIIDTLSCPKPSYQTGIPKCGEPITIEAPNKIWKYEGTVQEAHYFEKDISHRVVHLMCLED